MANVTDGLSNTILVVEDSNRPQMYHGRGLVPGDPVTSPVRVYVTGATWASDLKGLVVDGATYDGSVIPGPCGVNCSNDNEIYSFHLGGANVLMADGSVRSSRSKHRSTPSLR